MATYVAPLPLIVGPARETSRFGTRDGFHGVEDLSSCAVRACRSLSPSCEGSRIVQMAHAFAHYRWSLEITLQSCRVDIPWARMHRFRSRDGDQDGAFLVRQTMLFRWTWSVVIPRPCVHSRHFGRTFIAFASAWRRKNHSKLGTHSRDQMARCLALQSRGHGLAVT